MSTRAGARLRAWMKENGHTQKTFAEAIGTSQTNVSAWTLGRTISLTHAVRIETLTGIPVEEWVEPEESGPSLPDIADTG